MPRENSFRLGRECSFRGAGLLRESTLLLGAGGGREPSPEPPVTSATIPRLVEDLTEHLRDMKQREDVPAAGAPPSTEEEKAQWSDTERARVEDLVLRVRKCMARVKSVIFPPETVEGGSSSGGGGGGGGGGSSGASHNVAVPGSSGDMGGVGRIEGLVRELIARDTWSYLLLHFTDLLFETRKAVSSVFVYYLRLDTGKGGVEDLGFKAYLCRHKNIVAQLVTCYDHETSALPAGSMLRELIKHCPVMHRALLVNDLEGGLSDSFEQLHGHLSNAQFEIASDAFDTFQTLLTCDKATVKAAISPDSPEEGAAARCARQRAPRSLWHAPSLSHPSRHPGHLLPPPRPPPTPGSRALSKSSMSSSTRWTTTCSSATRSSCSQSSSWTASTFPS